MMYVDNRVLLGGINGAGTNYSSSSLFNIYIVYHRYDISDQRRTLDLYCTVTIAGFLTGPNVFNHQ